MEGMLGELMLRDIGLMRGKGGTMHLTSVEHDVLGSYAIVGAHLLIACGLAWRAQYLGEKDVSVCFFGDGTTNIGAFHERSILQRSGSRTLHLQRRARAEDRR
jgi:TPP-dependent pyruvate/acetoin dehydrogenase alpha subunit